VSGLDFSTVHDAGFEAMHLSNRTLLSKTLDYGIRCIASWYDENYSTAILNTKENSWRQIKNGTER
jgi:hypothetical protein